MPIEFRCEHCNKEIRAPETTAGRTGKCPHCKGLNYVPLPEDEVGELPLAPLDRNEELRRSRAAAEDMALQWKLLHERASPDDPRSRNPGRTATANRPASAPTGASRRQLTAQIVSYVENLSQGKLTEADQLSRQLGSQKSDVGKILDEMMSEDLNGYGLPTLPRPVLVGFLKKLRMKI